MVAACAELGLKDGPVSRICYFFALLSSCISKSLMGRSPNVTVIKMLQSNIGRDLYIILLFTCIYLHYQSAL